VNHCGGLLGINAYANAENFRHWRDRIAEIALRPNVKMKLGGLSGGRTGFGYSGRAAPPTLDELVSDWRPYIESCIELFGVERCMFESNFPVDKISGSYRSLWNAFKAIVASYSDSEKRALFSGNALKTYRISLNA
jgi:L-fuconolactonase